MFDPKRQHLILKPTLLLDVSVLENPQKLQIIEDTLMDVAAAQTFLEVLDPASSDFCFRTFDDTKTNPFLASKCDGTYEYCTEVLTSKNASGAGIFVVINQGGQTDDDITRVRYVFADTDGAPLDPLTDALEPHMLIESSPKKYHVYWRVSDCQPTKFQTVQKAIAVKFHTDPAVNNLSRVMRLPGYFHQKSTPFQVRFVAATPDLASYTLDEIIDGLGLNIGPHQTVTPQTSLAAQAVASIHKPRTASFQGMNNVEEMLPYLEPFEDYGRWIKVGFMLADEFGEGGRDLFLRWSRGDLWIGARR